MTSHRITPLTESGLLSALTVILALAAVYLPVVGVVASLVWAIPVIVLVVRTGLFWLKPCISWCNQVCFANLL